MEEELDEEGEDGDGDVGKLGLASFEGASVPDRIAADCQNGRGEGGREVTGGIEKLVNNRCSA